MKRFAPRVHLAPESFGWLLVAALTVFVSLFKLGTLVPELAPGETPPASLHSLAHSVWYQPAGLPLIICRAVVRAVVHQPGPAAARLPDVIVGLFFVAVTAWLLRRWYGMRLALFGTVLIALSAWYLHVARLASLSSLYPLAVAVTLLLSSLLHQKAFTGRFIIGGAATLALLAYVPGGIWFILVLFVVERGNFKRLLSSQRGAVAAGCLLALVLLAPLIHSLAVNWRLSSVYAGLPAHWPAPLDVLRNFGEVWLNVFIHGYQQPLFNIAVLPIVSAFITVTFLGGLVLYGRHLHNSRTHILAALWIIATLLIALGGPITISALLPLVFAVATGGLGYLLQEWFQVFPRNPIARNFGLGLVIVAVIFAVTYELRSYYVAWPHAPATRTAFQRHE